MRGTLITSIDPELNNGRYTRICIASELNVYSSKFVKKGYFVSDLSGSDHIVCCFQLDSDHHTEIFLFKKACSKTFFMILKQLFNNKLKVKIMSFDMEHHPHQAN